jgi:hypothetical protein
MDVTPTPGDDLTSPSRPTRSRVKVDRRGIRHLPEDERDTFPVSSTFLPQKKQQLCSGKLAAAHDVAMASAVKSSRLLAGMHVQPMGTESAPWPHWRVFLKPPASCLAFLPVSGVNAPAAMSEFLKPLGTCTWLSLQPSRQMRSRPI